MEYEPFGFEDLEAYQKARAFRRRIYKLAKLLPSEEKFALGSQMRRAAVSLTNNLAEGYGRFTYKDRTHFTRQSRGSLMELVDDLSVCEDEEYAKKEHLDTMRIDAAEVLRLLNGYLAYLKKDRKQRKRIPNT